MIEGSSDKVRDVWIARSLSDHLSSFTFIVFVRSASPCATNASGSLESERVAISNTSCLFTADSGGAETIAAGSSDKRLRLPPGRASIEQHWTAFERIRSGGEGG